YPSGHLFPAQAAEKTIFVVPAQASLRGGIATKNLTCHREEENPETPCRTSPFARIRRQPIPPWIWLLPRRASLACSNATAPLCLTQMTRSPLPSPRPFSQWKATTPPPRRASTTPSRV